jgi:hypothetical protein
MTIRFVTGMVKTGRVNAFFSALPSAIIEVARHTATAMPLPRAKNDQPEVTTKCALS